MRAVARKAKVPAAEGRSFFRPPLTWHLHPSKI